MPQLFLFVPINTNAPKAHVGIGPRSNSAKNKPQQYEYKFELEMERGMLSRVEEYRRRARDCEQAAQETIDAGMKTLFQELGNKWLQLASEAELANQIENAVSGHPRRTRAENGSSALP